jgi:Phage MuF-C-terminal domain
VPCRLPIEKSLFAFLILEGNLYFAFRNSKNGAMELDKIRKEYKKALEEYKKGKLNRNYLFNLGKPCQELLDNGVSKVDILMFQRTVRKILKKRNLSIEQIGQLPELLQNPIAIFLFQNSDLTRIVLTEASENENPIVLAIAQEKLNGQAINELKSAYPKEKWVLAEWIEKKLQLWKKEKE